MADQNTAALQKSLPVKLKQAWEWYKTKLQGIEILEQAEKTANVPKEYIATAGLFLCLVVLFFGFGAGLMCNLVGFVYPAYASFKAIETKEEGYDTQWLT